MFSKNKTEIDPCSFVLWRLGDGLAEIFFGLLPVAASVIKKAEVIEQLGVAWRVVERLAIFRQSLGVISLLIVENRQKAADLLLARVELAGPFKEQDRFPRVAVGLKLPGRGQASLRRFFGG